MFVSVLSESGHFHILLVLKMKLLFTTFICVKSVVHNGRKIIKLSDVSLFSEISVKSLNLSELLTFRLFVCIL